MDAKDESKDSDTRSEKIEESGNPGPSLWGETPPTGESEAAEDSDGSAEGETPESIGPFEVLAELKRDATGSLYRVRNPKEDGELLLRAMSARWSLNAGAKKRFLDLASQLRRVVHGGIVPVLEIGESEGMPWFTMPSCKSMSLSEILHALEEQEVSPSKVGARSVGEILVGRRIDAEFEETWSGDWFDLVADIVMQVAKALHYTHDRGLFHGDLRPANILLGPDGRARVTDFGIARIEAQEVHQATGKFVGVPLFLSPEQVRWESESAASEVWALGVLLYRLGAGRLPYPGSTPERVFAAILGKEPKLPWKQNPRFPKDLGKITLQCLRKTPSARYATAEELALDLERFLDEKPVKARLPGPISRGFHWALAHPFQALPALLVLVIIAVIGMQTSSSSDSEERNTRQGTGDKHRTEAEEAARRKVAEEKRQSGSLAQAIASLIDRARRSRGRMRILFLGIEDEAGVGREKIAKLTEQMRFPGYVEIVSPRQTHKFLAHAGLEYEDLSNPAGMQALMRSMGLEFQAALRGSVTRDENNRPELHFDLREVGSHRLDRESLYLDGKARPGRGLAVKLASALEGLNQAWPALSSHAGIAFLGFQNGGRRLVAHAEQVLETKLLALQPTQLVTARATRRATTLARIAPSSLTTRQGGLALSKQLGLRLDYLLAGRLSAEGDKVLLTLHQITTGKQVASFEAR